MLLVVLRCCCCCWCVLSLLLLMELLLHRCCCCCCCLLLLLLLLARPLARCSLQQCLIGTVPESGLLRLQESELEQVLVLLLLMICFAIQEGSLVAALEVFWEVPLA
jgi:hypothetical protein